MINTRIPALVVILLLGISVMHGQNNDLFRKEQIKQRMLKAAHWQLKNPKHPLTDWTNGAFYAGIFAAYETTRSPELMKAMMEMGEKTNWQIGRRFDHADDIVISQTYIDLYRIHKDRRMIEPTITAIGRIRTESSPEVERHGIIWWWCDALFMAPPTLAKLGRTLNDQSYFDLNDKYFQETYGRLYDTDEHLFFRDEQFLIKPGRENLFESNGKKVFWSRGNGWVAGGLVRLLKELPKNHKRRGFYEGLFKEMMEKVLTLQQDDGLWRASLLDPAAYPGGEASGTGFFIYSMAWGVNNKILDRKRFLPAIRRGWVGLNSLVKDDGKVGWTQPIGRDPRKNFDAESWEVYGTGAYLLAGSEVVKL